MIRFGSGNIYFVAERIQICSTILSMVLYLKISVAGLN